MQNISRPVEPLLTSFLFSKAVKTLTPLSGTFELTPMCNFSCRMCYVRKSAEEVRNSPRKMMSLEQWLETAREAREEGLLYLLLTGGEPLTWPWFWELYDELSKMGFIISINTNGSMIDDAAIEHFRRVPPSKINITLYGASDETYERLCLAKGVFSKVDYAIKGLRAAGIQVKLNGTLTPYNIDDLEACVRYAEENGLIYETVTYMFPPLRRDETMIGRNERFTPAQAAEYHLKSYRLRFGEEAYTRFVRSVADGTTEPLGLDESCVDPIDGKIRCRAGKASFWITWDGKMTPCGMMTDPALDLAVLGFRSSWKKLTEVSALVRVSGKCAACENHSLCHACAAMAQAETGKSSGVPVYLCEMVRELKKIVVSEINREQKSNIET